MRGADGVVLQDHMLVLLVIVKRPFAHDDHEYKQVALTAVGH